jgi:hypothetical protein
MSEVIKSFEYEDAQAAQNFEMFLKHRGWEYTCDVEYCNQDFEKATYTVFDYGNTDKDHARLMVGYWESFLYEPTISLSQQVDSLNDKVKKLEEKLESKFKTNKPSDFWELDRQGVVNWYQERFSYFERGMISAKEIDRYSKMAQLRMEWLRIKDDRISWSR